jgi:5-methylcytosine-specific restriction enzyme A
MSGVGYTDVTADDVRTTLKEFDALGGTAFLKKYGYGSATRYYLLHEGRRYDSKAILGVAHRVSNGRALTYDEFSGGEKTAVAHLRKLGFVVRSFTNPDWTRDEVILACDLVVGNGWKPLAANRPEVVSLSQFLQQLHLHPMETRASDFRNPAGVARKTQNLADCHPDFDGTPSHGSKIDRQVVHDFLQRPDEMAATARAILKSPAESELVAVLADLDLESEPALEGRILERQHFMRERDRKLRARKIKDVKRKTGSVSCEACGFDFAQVYGDRGTDFIECHHRVPLHVTGETKTHLTDLVLLCSNCHRMIHRRAPWLTFEELCALLGTVV